MQLSQQSRQYACVCYGDVQQPTDKNKFESVSRPAGEGGGGF